MLVRHYTTQLTNSIHTFQLETISDLMNQDETLFRMRYYCFVVFSVLTFYLHCTFYYSISLQFSKMYSSEKSPFSKLLLELILVADTIVLLLE